MKRRAPWSIARLFVLLVLAVVMVSMMGTVAFAQEADNGADKECYLNGDMNVDGSFDTEDAIYTLFYTFFGEGMYPINQDCDINADESVDTNDAIALLYAAFFKDTGLYPEYEKYGETAHDYYDPAWSWEETPEGVAAKVTLQCACGEGSHELDAVVTAGQTVAATCTAAGSRAYTAAATVDGETFTATYTQVIAAAGHTAGEAAYDDNQHYTLCANCGEKLNAASHSWEADGEASAATCKVAAVQNYKCSCGATKSEELGFAEHAYEYVEDVLVEGETCQYAKKHQCADCGEVKLTDQYANHNYVASVKEATCQADGEKVYKCSLCGAVEKTETIAKSEDKHIWNDGVENAGVITYSCTVDGCGATKTAVTTSEDGTVSKDALQSADQLEVGDATLEMDETVKEGLDADKEIQITVDAMDVEEAEKNLENALTEEQKAQIGDNKVYDFNMSYSDGQKVNFDGGWITVSLPYTLAEGEDVDAIDVWYIADDGTLEKQTATYSNGYVTFQTNHFSYYTVTRLTPAERCERYGHIWTDANKAATCTADGYTKQVCQRCAKEANLVVIEKTGHNYQTTTTAATCEKFGSVVEKCANCGHTKSTVTPALGHAMQLSETVDATCDAAGKKVYTCANGCGHTKEEAIPQLTHSYKKDETKTVAATCTTGGYDIHVCEHCGNEIKKNETTPTGHHYGTDNAVWNWSADDTEATLVLTCDHECGSTKELAATVNIVKATCLGNGSVKASVFYNNKSYTDEKAGASATGHKPASEWSTTEDVHYYKCEACGAKLEEATHDMDNGVVTKEPTCTGDGLKVYTCAVCGYTEEEILPATGKHAFDDGKVTKEPTCTEAGLKVYTCAVCGETKEEVIDASGRHTYDDGVVTKEPTCKEKGTKVYTCTVCGFTREESIAATGNHSYVNGVCSVCGKEESACNHYKTTATLIDISAFGICKGMEIYEVKCECGQNRTLMVEKFACEMITISEGYNEDGTSMTYIEECKNCGLRAESGYYIEKAPDACRVQYVEWGKLIMNGVTVAEFSVVREESEEHPVYIVGEKTVLTDKGMCDLTIVTYSCPCGERTETNVSSACEWSYKGDVAYCTVCGAQRTYGIGEIIEDGCMFAVEYIYRYFNKNGEEVYTYNQKHTEYRHNYEATDYELYGDTCEDGIWVEYTCTECGEVHDEYNEGGYHPMVESTITDLEDAKICASAHIQYTCACGEAKEECLHYNVDDEICQWVQVIAPDGSVEGDAEYYRCSICGAIRTDVYETTDKDANCQYREKRTVIYVDANGNQIVTGMDMNTYTQHNMKYEYELKGESCEDGVIVTEYCADCGMSDFWEIEHHEVYEEFYDLADYGFCGGYVRFCSCPCGEYAWTEIEPWGCDWMGMGDEGWTYHECRNCGGIWETWFEEVEIDACHSQMDYTHSFQMGDKEVLNIAYVENIDNHRWVYELTLLGETCNDGIYVKQTCLTCGETDEFGEEHIGHELWAIDREIVSEGQLCGTVEKVTYACACGERTRTECEWYDGECNFMHTGWGEEDDSYIYTCSECGAVRYERNFHEQVPGGTACQRQYRWEYTYSLKDEVLFVETGVSYYNEHDWIYDLTLMGETCEDGVIVRETCATCGEQAGERTIYHHEVFDKHFDLSELGLCGGYASIYGCACGQDAWAEIDPWGCDWETNVDEEGHVQRTCRSCGAVWDIWYEEEQIDDCHGKTNFTHSFQKDGKNVLSLDWSQNYNRHDYEETFELLGETCEDGVVVNRTCTKCGYSDRYETRDHEEFVLEEYDLADYGFCEGYLRVFGCACGKNRNVDYGAACTWYGMGGFGPGENSFSETCDNCGMVFTMTWNDGEALDSCHTKVDRTVSFAKGDVAILAAYHEIETHHRIVHSLSFWEGSSSCQEGFYVTERCLNCGLEFGGWGTNGNHPTYIVDRQYITVDGDICGTVERLIYSCACGEETREEYLFDGCQFQDIYDEERGEWIFACVDCGVERIYEYAEVPVEGETCKVEATRTYTFVQNGTVLASYTTKRVETSHNTVAQLTLVNPEGTCDDGYTITWVCQDCGEVTGNSGVNYGCVRRLVNRELVVPEGVLCGTLYLDTYSCACGKESHTQNHWEGESCSFRWDVEKQADVCANCGVERCSTTDRKYIEGTVCEYQCTEVVTFLRDGKELYSYTRTYKTISHNSVAQLTLVNPDGTCDDGWTRAWVCADCGMDMGADEQVYYGCQTHRISEELLASKDVLCGDLYQFTNRCACGKVTETGRYWSNGSCDFRETGYDEAERCYTYTCEKCGAYRRDYSEDTQVDRCHRQHTWTDIYYDANGNQLFTESGSNVYHSPSWIYTYQLNGKTCDEGYTRFGKCAYCDETYEDTQVYYGCSTNRVEIVEIVADSDKVCGPIELVVYSCACGKESHWNMDRDCRFSWLGYDEVAQADRYQCADCGLIYTEKDETIRQPGTCLVTEIIDRVYTVTDGEATVEVGSINRVFERREHSSVATLTLVEGATSCEDGYYMSQHCIYCDYTWSSDEIRYDHDTWRIACYALEDYGKCGGSVEGHSCACGKNESWSYWDGDCNYVWTGEKNEYGVSERYCETCNTYFYMDDVSEYVREECHDRSTLYARLIRDGETLLDLVEEYEQESHTMIVVGYDGTCGDDNITVYQQCYYCGEQRTENWGGGHPALTLDCLDLTAAGTCGGFIRQYSCPCGEENSIWWEDIQCMWDYTMWEEQEHDGVLYYTRTRTCNTCGLVVKETYHDEEPDENCRYNRIYTYEFWMNDKLLKSYNETNRHEDHNYTLTNVELQGESCEDGVIFTYTCKCGASHTNHYSYHAKYQHADKTIDLSQYGSVCGCELEFHGCACGAEQSYEISNQNCDIDSRYVDVWVEGALNEGQETTEGWRSAYSYAYTYTCAVTDPQCGLKIRMGSIWLKGDNCTAVQYQYWQLGYQEIYDETTGETTYSWEKEIVIPTGNTMTFHDYTYTSGTNYLDDGTQVNYQDYLCNDCGSSWHAEDHYLNGNHTYSESVKINTLDNGETKQVRTVAEYGFLHNGSAYETLRTWNRINADGSEWWEKREISYTSADACKYVCTETNSDGYSNTWENDHYFTTNNWSWIEEPTCSQPGVEQRTEICQLCNEVVDVELYDANPHRHSWYWDFEKECYFCSRCGLENSNGADGTIVVEDLTAGYGNGTDYVVGYWNQGNGEFTIYASVILDDVTDDNDEIVLTGIEFTYLTREENEINAISTNQAAIQEAAKAAIADAGYTGSYAIRIAFVPADSDGTLDYAITFDSQTA